MSTILRYMVWPQCEFRMQIWNVLHAARCKYRTQKIAISAPSRNFVYISSTCPHNMVNLGLLSAEIFWRVWGTPANFNGFRVLAAFLHGILLVGVNQTLRRWTEGATYTRQGDHHVGHWPTFLVIIIFVDMMLFREDNRMSLKFLRRAKCCSARQLWKECIHVLNGIELNRNRFVFGDSPSTTVTRHVACDWRQWVCL